MFAKITYLEKYLFAIPLLLVFVIEDYLLGSKILVVYSLLILLRLILFYQKVAPVVILLIFISSYVGPYFSHFFQGYDVSMWQSFNNSYYLSKAILIFSFFLYSILIFTKKNKDYVAIAKRLNVRPSTKIFYSSILIAFLLVQFGLSGETLLSGLDYGVIEYQRSALFEYSIFFFLISYTYSNKKKIQLYILFSFISVLILKDFIFGGRITSLMLCLLIYLINFEYRVSNFKIFILIIVFIFVLNLVSLVRSNPLQFLQNGFDLELFYDFLFNGNKNKIIISTEGDLAHSSARIIGMIENNIISTTDRLKSLFYNIISIFTPGIELSELSNMSSYKKDVYGTGGGVLFPVSFYIWLSYPGVILSGFIVSKMIKLFIETNSNRSIIYLLLVFSVFPRWFSYSTIVMFKLCVYGMLVFILFNSFKRIKQ